MDAQIFGLTDRPFSSAPDPDFFFDSTGHARVLKHLGQAIEQGDRLILLTGNAGVGKTTVVQKLQRGLDRASISCVELAGAQLDTDDLADSLARAFGAPDDDLQAVHASRAGNRAMLAVIDDAHLLRAEAIERLGALAGEGPLRVLLAGQPALRAMLQQRLPLQPASMSCHLEPLLEAETAAYIEHRLRRVGWSGTPEFTAQAHALIHRATAGVPLRINRLCDRLLRAAHRRDERTIEAAAVQRVIRPRRDDASIPVLTTAIDEPLTSGWAPSSLLPPQAEPPPPWAREPMADTQASGLRAMFQRHRPGIVVLSAAVVAVAMSVLAYRAFTAPPKIDASMTSTPAKAPSNETPPPSARLPSAAPPATSPTIGDVAAVEPRPAPESPPRTALPAPRTSPAAPRPASRPATPATSPTPVPGPCTTTVAALGLCTPTENSR
jgi:type II secretory pathway predicted ATPase ExeA